MTQPQSTPQRDFFVVGVTHIDLAWKRGSREMTEMLEILVIRLLDALESEPNFRYMIEQAAHYRTLQKTRPDLIARLKPYVQSGRLEMVGGMASTLENNLPNGESFVRNQAIGMKWVKENLGVDVKTGWLFDTFGVHAQTPQILRQFGLRHLMANRFGGATFHDIFHARGLDGSQILIVGRETYSAFVRRENTARQFYVTWDGLDQLFADADTLPGDGPLLLIPYVENEYLLSLEPLRIARERNADAARPNETYRLATPGEYFAALETAPTTANRQWPVIHGDLNPEFTGCFSLRPHIRLRNRQAETQLLEAEKWASLQGLTGWKAPLEEAWWRMAFLQFHDVFTGSHPTAVYREVMENFDKADEIATEILDRALDALIPAPPTTGDALTVYAVTGLTGNHWELIRAPLGDLQGAFVTRVMNHAGDVLPFEVRNNELRFMAVLPSVGVAAFAVETQSGTAPPPPATPVASDTARIENDFFALEADATVGVRRLSWKANNAAILENVGDFLVVQRDDGTFQIESPNGAEIAACAGGAMRLETETSTAIGETLRLSGAFPPLAWLGGPDHPSTWEVEFHLRPAKLRVDVTVRLDWRGEAARVRLKIPTGINAAGGVFEIPFGTVERKPYGVKGNARGEWPAHRFVTVQDHARGLALANTGVGGVEVAGGTIWTTLLRAPKGADIGMKPDDTSSQHGKHEFRFALIPYQGDWKTNRVVEAALELNNPAQVVVRRGAPAALSPDVSFLSLAPNNLVLSAVKNAEDKSGDLIVRFYETAGTACEAILDVRGATGATASDLREATGGAALPCIGERIAVPVAPFEIKTVRVSRGGGGGKGEAP